MDRETLRKLLYVCDLRCFDEEGFRCSETFCEAEERIWAEIERLKAEIERLKADTLNHF